MDPFLGGTLLQLGGGLLGGLSQGGRYKQALGDFRTADSRLGGMTGQKPFDPYQIAALQRRSVAGDTRRLGEQLDSRYGLDIGAGAGGLWGQMLGQQQSQLGQGLMQSGMAGFNRDFDINALRARLAAQRLGSI